MGPKGPAGDWLIDGAGWRPKVAGEKWVGAVGISMFRFSKDFSSISAFLNKMFISLTISFHIMHESGRLD